MITMRMDLISAQRRCVCVCERGRRAREAANSTKFEALLVEGFVGLDWQARFRLTQRGLEEDWQNWQNWQRENKTVDPVAWIISTTMWP